MRISHCIPEEDLLFRLFVNLSSSRQKMLLSGQLTIKFPNVSHVWFPSTKSLKKCAVKVTAFTKMAFLKKTRWIDLFLLEVVPQKGGDNGYRFIIADKNPVQSLSPSVSIGRVRCRDSKKSSSLLCQYLNDLPIYSHVRQTSSTLRCSVRHSAELYRVLQT